MSRRPFNSTCFQTSHTIPASHPRHPNTLHDANAQLQLSVDEYTVCGAIAGSATLIFTHGTSFSKKLWEPTIWRLLKAMEGGGSSCCVKRILAIDASNHGDSYLLNANILRQNCEIDP
ncbi:hypothetical protein BKA64DRAFT_24398 [Cadophora sp. MPI-SDFR-AT-0126]|nr:hypothetical protein BKA64DRAFT_24398 [Leotiomycetes sp. MPI-SDFR-AT-0126]